MDGAGPGDRGAARAGGELGSGLTLNLTPRAEPAGSRVMDSGIKRVPSGRCDFGGHHRGGIQGLAEVTMPYEVACKRPHIQEGDQPKQEGEHGAPPGVRDPKQRLGCGLPRSSARLLQSCAAPCGLGTCRTWLWAGGCRAGLASRA